MKKIQLVFKVGLMISALILIFGNSNNPPNGRTGAPAEGTCLDCHSPTNLDFDGDFEIFGLPDKLIPKTIYNLTARISVTSGTPQRAGFQLVALDANNVNAGNLAAQGNNTFIENSGGRIYVEHRPAEMIDSNFVEYNFEWFSPETAGQDSIIFYGASVLADGNGANSNDQVLFLEKKVYLSDNLSIFVGITSTNPTCFGGNDGTATAGAGAGFGNFTFLWSNGDSTETARNLSAGIHEVTVTDEQGHQAIASVEIIEPEEINPNEDISDLTSIGGSDGSISLSPIGGTPGYTFLWPQTGDTTSTLSNLPFGPRWVVVTDVNGCVKSDTFFINNPLCNLGVEIQTQDVSCFGQSDGETFITVNGGVAPFTFDFNIDVSNGISAGNYSVTILDAINCGIIDSFSISQPTKIDVDPIITESCKDRTVSLNVSGGVPPYEFLWMGGSTDSFNVITDTLLVDVTDANGCLFAISRLLDPIDLLTVVLDSVSINESTIFVTPEGGSPPYSFIWEDVNGNDISTSEDLTGLILDGNKYQTIFFGWSFSF